MKGSCALWESVSNRKKIYTVRILLYQSKNTIMYFMLIRYILYEQFRTTCDFTFAASHKKYLLSCSAILLSNCPSHYTSHTTIHS